MLVLHDPSDYDNLIPLAINDDEWYVTHAYNGFDTCTFEIAAKSKYRQYVQEEAEVEFIGGRGGNNIFVIKNVDEHSDFVTVDCDIKLDDWKTSIYPSFRETYATLEDILEIITPDGWTYSGQEQFTKSTTIEGNEGEPMEAVTPLAVLDACTEAYGVIFNFDTVNKELKCIDTDSYTPSGDFLMEDLNLESLGFVGNTSNFATRLYAYGVKDEETGQPLTFASINGGKPYVEDVSYCDKIICIGWSDERYTTQEGLLEAAKQKLAEVSKPNRSYECSGARLQTNIWMYKVVTLIDDRRKIRIDHQIVEWEEHPNKAEDKITLSALPPSLESLIKDTISTDDKIQEAVNEATNAYQQAIKDATDKITGSYGGYFHWIFDANGNPMELVNTADSEDINSAQHVWRWNQAGLGHSNNGYNGTYGLALLSDGSINASMMTVGIIQGGQSRWNLNTGDLDLIGTFRTRADSAMAGSTELYGVEISPEFKQFETSGEDKMYGSGVRFTAGDQRAYVPYIASEMSTLEEALVSAIVMNSGRVMENDPGSWLRLGVRNDGGTSDLNKNAHVFLGAYSRYNSGGSSEYSSINMQSVQEVNGAPVGEVSARVQSKTSAGFVGINAEGRNDTGAMSETIYIGGILSGLTGISTFNNVWWSDQKIRAYQVGTYTTTLNNPSRRGRYKALSTVSMTMTTSDMHAIIDTVGNCSASGWNIHLFTLPDFLNARRNSGDSWSSFKVWNGTDKSFDLHSVGFLAKS